MATITTAQLNVLLEKTSDWDKDERYMATNDLCSALSKDIKIDENMEQRICAAVLKQLDDKSNDVQSVAVKCLAIILKKVQQTQIGEICKKLCALILDGQDALRDIYSIGLKTLIADVPDSMGNLVVEKLTANLLTGISRPGAEDIKRECLDLMSDLLKRFGNLNDREHIDIMNAAVAQLEHEKVIIRKRAANCLGSLAVVSSDALLNRLVQTLLEKIESSEKKSSSSSQETRTLIQTIGTISRTVGYRLGRHLERIIPLFVRFCGDPADESQHTDTANELRENCFPGLESFVLRCPREVSPFLQSILKVALAFLKYDPNYYDDEDDNVVEMGNDDEDQNDPGAMGSDAEDDMDFDQQDDFGAGSDNDDTSWKVRKAAIKVISAVISTARPELLHDLYDTCGDDLISRFKEREENVRLDVIACFTLLVQATSVNSTSNSSSGNAGNARSSAGATSGGIPAAPALVRQRSTVNQLESRTQQIVAASLNQLAGQSLKTKSAIFTMLRAVVTALNGGLDKHVTRLLTAADKCLLEKNQALKLDALIFVRLTLDHHAPSVSQPSLARLLPQITSIVGEDWYKIIAEALRLLGSVVAVMRPKDVTSASGFAASDFNYQAFVPRIYAAILSRLEALDLDQEIKECAILSMGRLVSTVGDNLQSGQLASVLALLQRRLENETTRSAALKALISIASSSLRLDLSGFVASSVGGLALFLRQNSRTLQQLTLQTLDALVQSASAHLTSEQISAILAESNNLISDTDLYLTHLSLRLTSSLLAKDAALTADPLYRHVFGKSIELAKSALVQGVALQSLIKLFQDVTRLNLPRMTFVEIFQSLYVSTISSKASADALSKQALSNLSKCIAGVVITLPAAALGDVVVRFTTDLKSKDEVTRQLALWCVGEVGQHTDLSGVKNLDALILECFESSAEDTKMAAAYALGHIAVGNMGAFLPVALKSAATARHQYLLLASLKEIIVVFANQSRDFQPFLSTVLPVLLQQCKSEEESVRNMVAECLGVLTAMNSVLIIPVLLDLIRDPQDALSRSMIANALRFSLSRASSVASITALAGVMNQFLPLLEDADLEVKRAALLMVNTAVHHNPVTVESHLLKYVVPLLIEVLKVKLERTVDLGPFKHKVDDNLPLRKVSLTCVETILDVMPDRVDVLALMSIMPLLLTDKDEIKLQTYQILVKLVSYAPGGVIGSIEQLVDPLDKTVSKKPNKDAPAGPETERANELVKSGLRAVLALNRLEDIASVSRKWSDFVERVKKTEHTAAFVQAIENEKSFESH